jgi:hypothetical protein
VFDGTRFLLPRLLHVVRVPGRVPLHSCVHRRVLPPRSTAVYLQFATAPYSLMCYMYVQVHVFVHSRLARLDVCGMRAIVSGKISRGISATIQVVLFSVL